MGASSSKASDSVRKLSTTLTGTRDHIILGLSKKGTFYYDDSLEPYMEVQMRAVRVKRYLDPMKAQGYGFGHEFLVVDLRTPDDDQILIRAEKRFIGLNHKEYEPGGRTEVTRITDPPNFTIDHRDRVKYEVDLQDSGKIPMKDLMDILGRLGACHPRYSLWKYNCWKYAYDTFKNLLENFARLADTSGYRKEKIREALERMPPPTLPVEVVVEAGGTLLGCLLLGPLFYWGAVGTVAAGKYLWGLKMALAAGTPVKGLAGSLLTSSITSAIASVAKRSWVKPVYEVWCAFLPVFVLVEKFVRMWQEHSC